MNICKSKINQLKKLFQKDIYSKVKFYKYIDRFVVVYLFKEKENITSRSIGFYF